MTITIQLLNILEFKRHISSYLYSWKEREDRKPLIVRGARQVGKTTLIEQFSKSYKYRILLNLEKTDDIKFFDDYNDVKTICDALFFAHKIPTSAIGQTILFIDEIQESSKAIHLLRYFYEDLADLHVIAAGSLLEFAMRKVTSFPVGRIEFLQLYPLNFREYLEAIDHVPALEQLAHIPVNKFAQPLLLELFNNYAIIGGMPEVIKTYLKNKSIADLPRVYESIWATYKGDVEKYAKSEIERRVIKHIMDTAHLSLDKRIKFQNFGNSNYRSREVSEALRSLDSARVIQLIYPTSDLTPPISPQLRKSPRLQILDTGLVNHNLEIQSQMLAMTDLNSAHKGAIIPHLISQEVMSLNIIRHKKPMFWVREKKQASSEVDLVFPYKSKLYPVEIKSGSTGSLKSLHQFVEQSEHPYAIRMYAGEFRVDETKTPGGTPYSLMNLPYYLGTKLPEYIHYFVNNHREYKNTP